MIVGSATPGSAQVHLGPVPLELSTLGYRAKGTSGCRWVEAANHLNSNQGAGLQSAGGANISRAGPRGGRGGRELGRWWDVGGPCRQL